MEPGEVEWWALRDSSSCSNRSSGCLWRVRYVVGAACSMTGRLARRQRLAHTRCPMVLMRLTRGAWRHALKGLGVASSRPATCKGSSSSSRNYPRTLTSGKWDLWAHLAIGVAARRLRLYRGSRREVQARAVVTHGGGVTHGCAVIHGGGLIQSWQWRSDWIRAPINHPR